ncbi:MAG: hypothetical protein IKY23_03405 [Lachnospiraceae bacterium]|nr:hypothetical protein [Lachnospiraceae bacterium]
MKRTIKEIILRVIILLIGLTIAHLGVTLFLLADLGADPFNVLIQGLFRTIAEITGIPWLTHGYTHMAVCFLIIIVLLIVDKSYIKIGTLLCMFCGGPIIDFFTWLFGSVIHAGNPFVIRILVLGLGCVILAYGMTIVIKSDSGTGPNDLVAIVISDKTKKPFGIMRIVVDVCFVAAGFLMGGVVGIGTIICAALVGPVAGIFLPVNEKMVNTIVDKFMRK